MRRTISLTLTAALLLISMATSSCSIRRDYYMEHFSETVDESGQATKEPVIEFVTNASGDVVTTPDGEPVTEIMTEIVTESMTSPHSGHTDDPAAGGNPYAGMTTDELIDLYYDNYRNAAFEEQSSRNTPFYYILDIASGGRAYSKLTGEVVTLCKDPLCDHSGCCFRGDTTIEQTLCADGRVYMMVKRYSYSLEVPMSETFILYSFDYTMNDVKLIGTWVGEDAPAMLSFYDGNLYYAGYYRRDGETERRVFILDPATGKSSLFEPPEENKYGSYRTVSGQYLYYQDMYNASIWRHDLVTGEDKCVVPDTVMDPENGDWTMAFDFATPDGKTVAMMILSNGYNSQRFIWVNTETSEVEARYSGRVCGEYQLAFKNHTGDDFKDDPFYDYYNWDPAKEPFGHANKVGGDLWLLAPGSDTEERFLHVSCDGVPDDLGFTGMYAGSDGRCWYMTYATYQNYQNEYHPTPGKAGEVTDGLMLLDMWEMKEYHYGADHDVVWFPDRTN